MNNSSDFINKQFDRVSEEYDFVSELFNNKFLFLICHLKRIEH
jgi:hypothetical protein